MRKLSGVVLPSLFYLILACGADAGSVKVLSGAYCDAVFEGDIADGDLQQIQQISDKLFDKLKGVNRDPRLCLNSPGGSFEEGLKIIKYLNSGSVSLNTVIDKNQKCFSACALVFMFGHHNEGDEMDEPHRELHVLGSLAFHAPYLDFGKGTYDQNVVMTAYLEGVRAIGRLLDADWYKWFPRPTLIAALKAGPDEAVFADSVAIASAWKIDLIGYKEPTEITSKMLEWACLNLTKRDDDSVRWLSRWWGDDDFGAHSVPKEGTNAPIKFVAQKFRATFSGFGSEANYKCIVDVFKSQANKTYVTINFDADPNKPVPKPGALEAAIKKDTFVDTIPNWMLYPSDAKLPTIAGP